MAGLTAIAAPAGAQSYRDELLLDVMFAELRTTTDADRGEWLGREIVRRWQRSGNPVVDADLARGQQLLHAGQTRDALDTFTRVVALAPTFAEGWNKLAHAYFLRGEYAEAIAATERTLQLEPRHFLALAGLGVIYLRVGEARQALDAFERALAINPHLAGTRKEAERLREIYRERKI